MIPNFSRSWPSGLIFSITALFLLMCGLLYWLFTLQADHHTQEREALVRRQQGMVESGRALLRQNQALIRERVTSALRQGERQAFLAGWIDLSQMQMTVTRPMPDFRLQDTHNQRLQDTHQFQLQDTHNQLQDIQESTQVYQLEQLEDTQEPTKVEQQNQDTHNQVGQNQDTHNQVGQNHNQLQDIQESTQLYQLEDTQEPTKVEQQNQDTHNQVSVTYWTSLLTSDLVLRSGFPQKLIATVELAKLGDDLDEMQQRQWIENMTRLWHNLDELDLFSYYVLITELPVDYQAAFKVQINLIRKALSLEGAEGDFITTDTKIGMIEVPLEAWEDIRDGLTVMGLTFQDGRLGELDPQTAMFEATQRLTDQQARDRWFFFLGCLLIIAIFGLVLVALNAMIQAHQQRQTLLHSVSHEFRTPLASVLQFSEMLLDKRYASPEKADLYLRHLHNEGLRLQGLLENVLAFARIEKRIFNIHPQRTEVVAFLQDMEQQVLLPDSYFAEHLCFDVEHGPCDVLLDSESFIKVLRNLLENAKKYAEPPLRVRSRIFQDQWVLDVCDQGPGLPREVLRRGLFGRKKHTSGSGLGLGLHLVKSIVNHHQGSIQFQTLKPKGLCVTIKLPIIEKESS